MTGLTSIKMSLRRPRKYVHRFSIRFALSDLLVMEAIKECGEEPKDADVSGALEILREVLNRGDLENKHRIPEEAADDKFVDIIITFDEAHTLSQHLDGATDTESRFIALRRVLNGLKSEPLFTFFLSTTGKITQFGQSRVRDPSSRVFGGQLATPRPYIYLGFDQLMEDRKLFSPASSSTATLTLKDVTSMEFAAHLGRPL